MKRTAKKEKAYPVIDGRRTHYVRVPHRLQPDEIYNFPIKLEPYKWVCVDVLEDGYRHLITPGMANTEAECQKWCDSHNKWLGFTPEEVTRIVGKSMGLIKA